MSAHRKKQRRIRDLRGLVDTGWITRLEADAIGAVHGLGVVGTHRPGRRAEPSAGRHPHKPTRWTLDRAREARDSRTRRLSFERPR